jgi:hypothetical protein
LYRVTPFQALVFVEVVARAELDIQFQMARVGFDAHIYGLRAEALAVRSLASAVEVVKQVNLLLLSGCEVDIVLCGHRIIVFCFGCWVCMLVKEFMILDLQGRAIYAATYAPWWKE